MPAFNFTAYFGRACSDAEGELAALSASGEKAPAERAAWGPDTARTPAAPALARNIAVQIAQAAAGAERAVEITLDPVELGTVRLTLQQSESGINVLNSAERPETIELMRRHASSLEEEFREIGYQDVEFSFSEHKKEGFPAGSDDKPTWLKVEESLGLISDQLGLSPVASGPAIGGLDLRL